MTNSTSLYTKDNNTITSSLLLNNLCFAKVRPDAIIPTKEDENAGYDIYANFEEDFLVIPPHKTVLVPTGIASAVPEGFYLQVQERGSTGKIGMKYSAGVIDSGYRGEIFIALSNINDKEIIISKLAKQDLIDKYGKKYKNCHNDIFIKYGQRNEACLIDSTSEVGYSCEAIIYPYSKAIAQLIVHVVPKIDVKEISYKELQKIPSKRGAGALGSSGK